MEKILFHFCDEPPSEPAFSHSSNIYIPYL